MLKEKTDLQSENPLLRHIPEFKDLGELNRAMTCRPLHGVNVKRLSVIQRSSYLVGEKDLIVPTQQALKTALILNGMLRRHLELIDPRKIEARRRYWEQLKGDPSVAELEYGRHPEGISTFVIKGVTGTGKSTTLKQYLRLLPQIISHGPGSIPGWHEFRQLVYLYVELSSDGSRGGFLSDILRQLDKALGTDYAQDLPVRYRTIEKMMLFILDKIVAHMTGLILVDECQPRTLNYGSQSELMQLLILKLINSGTPVVLTGNQAAFDWITYSQDQSRLSLNEMQNFCPLGSLDYVDSDVATEVALKGVMEYYVLREPVTDPEECREKLLFFSGGIVRQALAMWCHAQMNALTSRQETVTPQDLEDVFWHSTYNGIRPTLMAFAKRDPVLIRTIPDVDADFFLKAWGKDPAMEPSNQIPAVASEEKEGASIARKPPDEKSKVKAARTRRQNKDKAREGLREKLSDEDMRKNGLSAHHLSGLNALEEKARQDLHATKERPKNASGTDSR